MKNSGISIEEFRRKFVSAVSFLVLSIFVNAATIAQDSEPQLMRWKFAEGDQFEFDFTQKLAQSTDINGKKFEYQINFDLGMTWKVKSVEGDQATIEQSFRKLTAEWTSAKGTMLKFDSESQDQLSGKAKEVADSLLPILKCTFDVVMNTRGEIVSVESDDETKKILRSIPDSMAMRKMFTSEGISKTLSQAAIVLPEEPVAEGHSWTVSEEIVSPTGKVTYSRTYKIGGTTEVDGQDLQKIDLTGTIEFDQKLEDDARKPQTVVENEQTGTILFDGKNGNFVSGNVSQTLATETPYRDITLHAGTKTDLTVKVTRTLK